MLHRAAARQGAKHVTDCSDAGKLQSDNSHTSAVQVHTMTGITIGLGVCAHEYEDRLHGYSVAYPETL